MFSNSAKFKNKFRLETIRLKQYDYSQNGMYFITICTRERFHFFGTIKNDTMQLTAIGEIASFFWTEIPTHFPFVQLDEFVVMPNHVHGILSINNKREQHVETQDFASLPYKNKFGPQSKNLSSIIRGYKAAVRKYAVINNIDFYWQPRFYERVIRTERELHATREYIQNNPVKWAEDEENIEL